ncbi:hypothetical protein BGZ94_006208, partial [Podila epigama]
MDPEQPNGQTPLNVVPPQVENEQQNGLAVVPPQAEVEHPVPQIPGHARLEAAVGKAVGGTIIPSDISPADQPNLEKLEAAKAEQGTAEPEPAPVTPEAKGEKPVPVDGNGAVPENPKKRTVGAYPVETRI